MGAVHDHTIRGRFHAWFLGKIEEAMDRIHGERKRRLFADLPQTIVELGPGVGANLRYYRPGSSVIAIEPNPHMHEALLAKAKRRGLELEVRGMKGERMDLPSERAEVVVCTFVLCSVDDPRRVVSEVLRVLRPGGRFAFVEHVAAPRGTWLRRVQDLVQPPWSWWFEGCRPNRDTASVLESAGFSALNLERFHLASFAHVAPHVSGVGVK